MARVRVRQAKVNVGEVLTQLDRYLAFMQTNKGRAPETVVLTNDQFDAVVKHLDGKTVYQGTRLVKERDYNKWLEQDG